MRIAAVNSHRARIGGAETYIDTVLPALGAAGHPISFLFVSRPAPGAPLIRLPVGTESWCAAKLGWERAIEALKAWRPDVLYVHAMDHPMEMSRVLQCAPTVLFAHGYSGTCISGHKMFSAPRPVPCARVFGPLCFGHYYPHRCGGLDPLRMVRSYRDQRVQLDLMRGCAMILTASEHMRLELLRHGCASESVRSITLPVALPDPGELSPDSAETGQAASLAGEQVLRLLYAGRMTRLKGGPIMFDAVAAAAPLLNRPIQLVLVGDGPERAAWERIANRVAASNPGNISIEFRGTLDHVMLGRTMRNSDLLIVPSTWPEPFGLVGPEAGLRGLPAVAFSVGGIPEWLTDGINGRLAPGDPPSADGLARAIVQCVRDPDELARMGRRACESFSSGRFALDRHVSELLRIFERAIEPDAAARSC